MRVLERLGIHGLAPGLLVALSACPSPEAEEDGSSGAGSDEVSEDADTDEGPSPSGPLLDHEAWEDLPLAEDPLPTHQPETVECTVAGWYVENGRTEIDTNFCNYLALRQPLLADVAAGDPLVLEFFYFDLVAPEPASAHIAALLDGQILWEQTIDIPMDEDGSGAFAAADFLTLEFDAPVGAQAGAELSFHLHNHGQNTWTLSDLRHAP